MEPEEEFIENATTLVRYAKEELKQFLAWTDAKTPYGQHAAKLIQQLDVLSQEMKVLRQAYKNR